MKDEEFIDRLNKAFIKHERILKLNHSKSNDRYFDVALYDLKNEKQLLRFDTIETMIYGTFFIDGDQPMSIFEIIEFENEHAKSNHKNNFIFPKELSELIRNIKGYSKEEISLKLQLMGY